MTRVAAAIITAADVVLAVLALVLVLGSDDLATILVGDVIACAACLLAVPLLHYWIEGRP